ncbi:MAG: hypothetical protein ACKVS6_04060 [Planctomycetota bacterium]
MDQFFRGGIAGQYQARIFSRLKKAHPNAVIWVGAPMSSVPPKPVATILLERAGEHEITLEPVPLTDPPNVTMFDASSLQAGTLKFGTVTVHVVDESGDHIPLGGMLQFTWRNPSNTESNRADRYTGSKMQINAGKKARVPAGNYDVWSMSSILDSNLKVREFHVSEDGSTTVNIVVGGGLRPCSVVVRRQDGSLVSSCSVHLRIEGTSEFLSIVGGTKEIWLPVGSGTMTIVGSTTSEGGTMKLEVKPRDGNSVQEIIYQQ